METPVVETTDQGSVNPADNLGKWFEDRLTRDAGPDAPAGQPEAADDAQPAAVDPVAAQPVTSWRDVEIGDDARNAYFKKKKVGDLETSYDHAVAAKQKSERERNELQRELEQLRREREADAAARRVAGEREAKPPADPQAELEALFWTDQAEYTRRVREMAKQDAIQEWEAAREVQEYQHTHSSAMSAGDAAMQAVMHHYGLDYETANARMAGAVFSLLPKLNGATAPLTDPQVLLDEYVAIYGPPQAAPVVTAPVPPAPELSNPPGSKKPAAMRPRVSEPSSMLNTEAEATRISLASAVGLDPDFVSERARARAGRTNA